MTAASQAPPNSITGNCLGRSIIQRTVPQCWLRMPSRRKTHEGKQARWPAAARAAGAVRDGAFNFGQPQKCCAFEPGRALAPAAASHASLSTKLTCRHLGPWSVAELNGLYAVFERPRF